MPNQLAVGATGGAFSTLLLGLFKEAILEDRLPRVAECICNPPDWATDLLDQPHLYWFLAGILVGICSGPILELFWLLREKWRRFVIRNLFGVPTAGGGSKSYYKVVYE